MAVTREIIFKLADEMDAAGEKPTLAAIRKRLGSGSYTTISDAMTEWHARRASQRTTPQDPVPEKVSEAASELTSLVWQVAQEIAAGRLQAERTAIDEERERMESEKAEAAAFADQLAQELESAKAKVIELSAALDASTQKLGGLEQERDQERARADKLQAVADERQGTIDTLKGELAQVRKDKEAEIARLVASMTDRKKKAP